MKKYYYIKGLRIIPKEYNKDTTDFKNIRDGNYFTDYNQAVITVKDIMSIIQKIKDRLD